MARTHTDPDGTGTHGLNKSGFSSISISLNLKLSAAGDVFDRNHLGSTLLDVILLSTWLFARMIEGQRCIWRG